jgi:hypothetical protein
MAYMRGQGVDESDARGAVAQRISTLQRALNLRLAGYGPEEQQAEQKTSNDYEGRGLFRSGQRLQDEQNTANDYERQKLGDISSTNDQIAQSQSDLAAQIAKMKREGAEQGLTSGYNMTLDNAGLSG